jgi:L-alanine-DL-glutamate epimerase-like enolase superfamily enzyme
MEKQNIKKTLVGNHIYELDERTLREAAADLIKLSEQYEAKGYENIRFDVDIEYDYTALKINGRRLETDDETIARERAEARRAEVNREHDLKVFKAMAERLGINIENIKEH